MSDQNFRDRRPSAARPPQARAGLSGRTPGQADDPITLTGMAASETDAGAPDAVYAEPPSEASHPRPEHVAPTRATEALPTSLRTSPPTTTTTPTTPSGPYSASAPESWRTAARNVAKRSGRPNPKSDSQHLRLKLDEAYDDDYYRGVPKSRLPVVVLAFLLLLAAAGGGAYWAQDHGGLVTLTERVRRLVREKLYGEPADEGAGPAATAATDTPTPGAAAASPTAPQNTGTANTVPPTAAGPAQPGAQVPSTAASAAASPATSADAPSTKPASDDSARALADPDMPTQAPSEANHDRADQNTGKDATKDTKTSNPAQAPAAARPTPDKPVARAAAPARTVVRHAPVIQIRDLNNPPAPGAPPEPSDMPYTPTRNEPPAPDEPR
jgi:hypothetical protein